MSGFRAVILAFPCIAIACALTGCSSKLSESQIHKTLDARKMHGQPVLNSFAAAVDPFEYAADAASDKRPCAERKYMDDARLGPEQKAMDAAGLLTFTPTGECTWSSAYTPLAQADVVKIESLSMVALDKLDSYHASDIRQNGNDATATLTVLFTLTPSGVAYAKSGFPFPHNGTACTLDTAAHTDTCVFPVKFHYWGSADGWNAEI